MPIIYISLLLLLLFGEMIGIIYVLGLGRINFPKRLKISAGILQILFTIVAVYCILNYSL